MTSGRRPAVAAALMCAVSVAGCGLGAGPSSQGTATLTVTRDYGTKELVQASDEDPPESETVIRLLDREAEIATRYGGGFVQSIDGVAGTQTGGRRYDWFFYVNGIESSVGSAEVPVHGGDRIWWDYRDWTNALRVPAVVGSWPEPFAQASAESDREAVSVECVDAPRACDTVVDRLDAAGVTARVRGGKGERAGGPATPRILVGPWRKVATDEAVGELRGGPAATGVFATFKGPIGGRYHLLGLGPTATPAVDLGPDAGLVAALKKTQAPPTWIVTGSRGLAVRRAASLLGGRALRDRYAVAADGGAPVALPVIRDHR